MKKVWVILFVAVLFLNVNASGLCTSIWGVTVDKKIALQMIGAVLPTVIYHVATRFKILNTPITKRIAFGKTHNITCTLHLDEIMGRTAPHLLQNIYDLIFAKDFLNLKRRITVGTAVFCGELMHATISKNNPLSVRLRRWSPQSLQPCVVHIPAHLLQSAIYGFEHYLFAKKNSTYLSCWFAVFFGVIVGGYHKDL